METFNDELLIKVAKTAYFSQTKRDLNIETVLGLKQLNDIHRNKLLKFIDAAKLQTAPSILQMKNQIFKIIGFESENRYGTMSRNEVSAIYNYLIKQQNGGK